jgi:hypothetical protein
MLSRAAFGLVKSDFPKLKWFCEVEEIGSVARKGSVWRVGSANTPDRFSSAFYWLWRVRKRRMPNGTRAAWWASAK